MKRSILAIGLILILVVTACGATAEPEATAVPTTVAEATLEPTTAPAEPTAAPEPTAASVEPTVEAPTAEATAAEGVPTAEPAEMPEDVAPTLRLPDLEGQTVVAVTGNDYTPLNFVDPLTGEAVGWEYDAVNEICRRLNCEVDWQVTSWDTMIAAVQDGQFDVGMDGITITDERREQVDFSIPYMVSQQFMLVRADEDRFSTPEEFAADEDLLIGSQT
ncbi:MAG TPA: transporter substrate-binding domain-containing protein, partial [Anaerolineae bacterium]|nr:transporter substrate-binding domain-containing protein [Anaerolineae bacterium]